MKVIAEMVKLYLQGSSIERSMREAAPGEEVQTGTLVRGLKWFGGRWSLGFVLRRDA